MYWYTGISREITPSGNDASFRAVTIISSTSSPVTVTRVTAESPPTFTVWQRVPPRETSVWEGTGKRSSVFPEPSLKGAMSVAVGVVVLGGAGDVGETVGEDVITDVGEGVGVRVVVPEGAGESVGETVGEGVITGVGEDVGVSVGSGGGDVVGTVVSGGARTVIYPERIRLPAPLKFRTINVTVYIPGVS